jgi:hypothetical protein
MIYRSQRKPASSPRGDVVNPGLTAVRSPGRTNGPSLPKPPTVGHIRSTAGAPARQVKPAEAAQARLFEDILRAEIAELLTLSPEARGERGARIQELERLLKALQDRFPRGPRVATPLERGLRAPRERAPRALLN